MRVRIGWRWGAALLGAVVLGLVATTTAQAQAAITIPMSVTENREPGLSGATTVTPLGNGMYRVDIRITGFAATSPASRPAHFHSAAGARCDTGAPVTYPLTNVAVAGGVGTSTTTITVTADKPLTANNAYVNVHNPAQMGQGVICGNVVTTLAPQGAAAAPGAQRPAGAPAAPQAQRPAAAPAAPAARPAAAPAAPAARPAQTLPRSGTGLQADTTGAWSFAGLALIGVLVAGSGALALARRRS